MASFQSIGAVSEPAFLDVHDVIGLHEVVRLEGESAHRCTNIACPAQIAERLNLAESSVANHISRALRLLRERVGRLPPMDRLVHRPSRDGSGASAQACLPVEASPSPPDFPVKSTESPWLRGA